MLLPDCERRMNDAESTGGHRWFPACWSCDRDRRRAEAEPAGLRTAHSGGARRAPHPPLVHRRPGPPQVGGDLPGRTGDRVRRGPPVRRLGDRRLQPDTGERRAGAPRRQHLRTAAVGIARRALWHRLLRHREPGRDPVRGRPPAGPAPQHRTGPGGGLRDVLCPRGRVLLSGPEHRYTRSPRPCLVFRPDHHGHLVGPPQAHPPHARGTVDPRGIFLPRGRPQPARDRPAVHRCP